MSDVFIPDTVEYIGDNIFYGCENLNKHIVVNDVFVWASRDTKGSFVVPKGIRRIAGGAFDGLADLTSVVISEGVTEIGWSAFSFCKRLHSVEMPSTLLKIEPYAFSCCDSLTFVKIPDSVEEIGDNIFLCSKKLSRIIVVNDMFVYMPRDFKGEYEVPNTVKRIVGGAFDWCQGLTSVRLPDGLEYIGCEAFCGCINLTTITLPATLNDIRYTVFAYCENMKEMHWRMERPECVKEYETLFEDFDEASCVLYVPAESAWLYRRHDVFKNFKAIIGEP